MFHQSTRARALIASTVLAFSATASAQFLEPDVQVLYVLHGQGGEFLGYVGNRCDDIDGDGADEMLLGAPFYSVPGPSAGRAHLISGATGEPLHAFVGPPGSGLGSAVNCAGDVNDDAIPDIILGGPGGVGRVEVYSGADYSLLWFAVGEAANDGFGSSVAGLRDDLDGDGFNDVLATAPRHDTAGTNAGRAYVLSGRDGMPVRTVDGFVAGDLLGNSIDSIEDLDGDGVRDLVVGARNAGPQLKGRAYVFSSANGAELRQFIPEPSAVDFGWFFTATVGDFDGDRVDDVYIPDFADAGLGPNTGRAYVFSGATGDKLHDWQGEAAGEGFGIGRGAGDVNGDGLADLFMAAWTSSAGAPAAGKGYVLAGGDGATLRSMTCTLAGAVLGYDAFAIGDLNRDGAAEFVLTGFGETPEQIAAGDGVAFVIAGNPVVCPGDFDGDGSIGLGDLGIVLAAYGVNGSGDVDGDGDTDLSDLGVVLSGFGAAC